MEFVITTVGKREDAENMAENLVKNGLSPCVNIIEDHESVYMWKGDIVHEKEYILLIKTQNREIISDHLKKAHPYDVPEIISFHGEIDSNEYEQWFNAYFNRKS